jgi:cytochrome P450
MNHIFTFPIVFIGVLCLNSIYGLLKNYWKARKIGLPIVITPVSLLGPVWALIWALAGGLIEPMLLSLPFGMGNWVTYSGHTWFFNHGYDLHKKYGPAFVIVTPTEIEVVIADPETAADLNNRRKEFIKDKRMYKPLEIFGPNVDTLNGEAWQRHRRFTAPPFNERNNKLVWGESLNQAAGILSAWTSVAAVKDGVANTVSDTMILALHVLQSAGFGKSYHYESGVSRLEDGHVMTYKDALRLILGNIFTTVVISSATVLPSFLLPEKVKEIKIAVVEFKKYMVEMVEKEKTSLHEPHTKEKSNLLSVLIKLSEQEHDRSGRKGLTDSELFGNLFFYNLAGHDTTASTLAYAVVLMASDTRWQNWIRHELDAVFEGRECKYWEYEKAFPRLKRCLALMVVLASLASGTTEIVLIFRGSMRLCGYTAPCPRFPSIRNLRPR